jgi:hypothetical protein
MTTRPEPGPPAGEIRLRELIERCGALAGGNRIAGSSGGGSRPGRRRRARRPGLVAGVAVAATVAVLGLGGTAIALSGHFGAKPSGAGPGGASGSASSSSTAGAPTVNTIESSGGKAAFTADATATPAATTSACATPVTFTVSGTISATAAGTVTYQWTGSAKMTGQVQTLHFSGPGTKRATGTTVQSKTAGTGWAAIKILSPKSAASTRATYLLDCSAGPVTVSAMAAATPTSRKVTCGSAPPSATFTGTIHDTKAGTVTYYWALPTGNGPTRSLTFSAPGAEAATPATVTAASDRSTESGTLVVLSPAAVSSNTATFSVSCTQPSPGGSSAPSGSSAPTSSSAPAQSAGFTVDLVTNQIQPKSVVCGSTPPTFQVFASFTPDKTYGTETYHWVRPNGTTTAPAKLSLTAGDTGSADDYYTPASDNFSGSETLVFTSPAQGSWSLPLVLTCSATGVNPVGLVNLLTDGTIGVSYMVADGVQNGTGPYTFSATGLPPGLKINPASGFVNGTPTVVGSYDVTVTVTDSESPPHSASASGTIVIRYQQLRIATAYLPMGTVGTAYPGGIFSGGGGDGTYSYAADSALPPGLSLSASGELSGTPTAAGTFAITVTVTDGESPPQTGTHTFTVTINPASLPPRAYQAPHSSAGLGSSGGVRNAGGAVRSSAPSGATAAASRWVSAGRFHFSSTSLSTEVWSNTSERTQSGRA